MTWFPAVLLNLAVFTALFHLSLACYSLRGFSRSRLDEYSNRNGDDSRFLEILKSWDSALVTCEVLLMLAGIGCLSTALATWSLLPAAEAGGLVWFNTILKWTGLLLLLFLVSVVLPRSFARTRGERFLFRNWPLIQTLTLVAYPSNRLAGFVDKILHRLYGLDEHDPENPELLTEEIQSMVEAGERIGVLDAHAHSMIDQVMDLKNEDVASVMTPRTEMCCLRADMSVEEARETVLEAGHTRMPLIGESTDDIVGILYAKDLLRYFGHSDASMPPLSEICREPFYVPETTRIDKLLQTMNGKRVHMAVVLDEYGGVAGVVTMEDLLEEIVGEITDEYDDEEVDPIQRVSAAVNELDARVHIDDLVEEFGYQLPDDRDYDTIGGFVFAHLGRIPESEESFEVGNLRITVLKADRRRIYRVRIERDESLAPAGRDDE